MGVGANRYPRDRLPLFVDDHAGEIECGLEHEIGFLMRAGHDLEPLRVAGGHQRSPQAAIARLERIDHDDRALRDNGNLKPIVPPGVGSGDKLSGPRAGIDGCAFPGRQPQRRSREHRPAEHPPGRSRDR